METQLDADGVLRLADSDPLQLPEVWRTVLNVGGKGWLRHLFSRATALRARSDHEGAPLRS
eukprot:3451040-Lingulodinium_polyedra.AAC.1